MAVIFKKLKPGQFYGLLFVLAVHASGFYGLWRYHAAQRVAEEPVQMVSLINPASEAKPSLPKPPEPPKPRHEEKVKPVETEHTHLAVQTPVLDASEPVEPPAPPLPAPPTPVAEPVTLSGELSVTCPERQPPVYPAFSMRLGEQGRVVLRVELSAEGRVFAVTYKSRSGFTRLDEAAVNAVKAWRCKPVYKGGVAVPAVALQPFDFILEGR